MPRLTVFLARSLELFMVLLVAGFWTRGGAGIESSVSDGPVLLSYATISLAMGVAMVVGHHVRSAGALPPARPGVRPRERCREILRRNPAG